jgi:hypothetical protein
MGDESSVAKQYPLSQNGRWLCMDAKDFDRDVDIALGAFNHDPSGNFLRGGYWQNHYY